MAAQTPSQTVGPFFSFALTGRPMAELAPPDAPGAIRIGGRVLDGAGDPVSDAVVEIWQADESGSYAAGRFGRCGTSADGSYRFVTVKPGPVEGAPHVVVMVFARGLLKQVLTRMYFPDEEANASDPVLAAAGERAGTLVARAHGDGFAFDVHLQGDEETAFFEL